MVHEYRVTETELENDKLKNLLGKGYVKVPDQATYTVSAKQTGTTFILPDLTADIVITLPTPKDGLFFHFIYGGVAQDAQDWQFDTGSDTNYFMGGINGHDTDGAGTQNYVVYPDGNSNSKMNILTPGGGTDIELYCDGTLWYLHGDVISSTDTAITFADQ